MKERRLHPRVPHSVTLRLRSPYGDQVNEGLTIDVSQTGVQVVLPQLTDGQFNLGDEMPFELVISPDDIIRGKVRVMRRSGGGHALGLQFCEPHQEHAFLDLLSDTAPAELQRPPASSTLEFPVLIVDAK